MRSRVVTPGEMREVFGAEVQAFPFSFRLTRRQKIKLEAHLESTHLSHLRQWQALSLPAPEPIATVETPT